MKLCSFKCGRESRIGILLDTGMVADANRAYAAFLGAQGCPQPRAFADALVPPSMIGLIENDEAGLAAVRDALRFAEADPTARSLDGGAITFRQDEIAFEAPVPRPSKIFAVAMNNKESFDAALKPQDPHPLYFVKVPSCVTGPFDPIEIPDIGIVGPEAEVAVIIGRQGKNISEVDAPGYIFGYTIHNDITAHELRDTREWIAIERPEGRRHLTFAGRYKCFDTFSPMGPWVVTAGEIPDPNDLEIEARLNGSLIQTGSTADMHFSLSRIISSLSHAHTLIPGDVISWGTVQRPIEGLDFLGLDLRAIEGVLETSVKGIGRMRNPIRPIP